MKGKRLLVFVLLGVIVFLFGLFSGHDWTLFAMRIADLENPEIYSRFMKFPVTFICMLLTWFILRDGFNPKDTQKLRIAYSLIVLGGAGAAGVILRRMQGPAMRAVMAGGLVVVAAWLAWETRT